MATIEKPSAIPPEILAEMRERAERAARRLRDPEDAQRACERMDRMREELRQKVGETDMSVASRGQIRWLRGVASRRQIR